MPSRFDEAPEDPLLLTPELAERVVERFAERQAQRQREEAAERERLASMTRVQELADLLGTTPDDVQKLAEEAREEPRVASSPLPSMAVHVPSQGPRWTLHAIYLGLLAVCAVWGASGRGPVDHQVPNARIPFLGVANPPMSPLRYDPYAQGYARNMGSLNAWNKPHELLVDASVLPPPTGLRVTLVTPVGDKTVAGLPGNVKDAPATVAALRKSIVSVLRYEESRANVVGDIPVADYDHAPIIENDASFQGQPMLIGWHVVEVATGKGKYRAFLPDRRYAKDVEAYEKALETRLDILCDAKFFPSRPPAFLRQGSQKINPTPALPKGMTLMIWNGQKTVWTQGTSPNASAYGLREAIKAATREAARRLRDSMGPNETSLSVSLIYPVSESRFNWPAGGASSSEDPTGLQTSVLADMVKVGGGHLHPEARPQGTIRIGSP